MEPVSGQTRRETILQRLRTAEPVSATALAKELGVSRQIIVGDVALLRAAGHPISATPRGYVSAAESGLTRVLACLHDSGQMEEELNAVVDMGCEVVDVIVEHPIYGQLTGALRLRSRYDVEQFLQKARQDGARPLSQLTGGLHLHTLRAESEAALERAQDKLEELGFLWREGEKS